MKNRIISAAGSIILNVVFWAIPFGVFQDACLLIHIWHSTQKPSITLRGKGQASEFFCIFILNSWQNYFFKIIYLLRKRWVCCWKLPNFLSLSSILVSPKLSDLFGDWSGSWTWGLATTNTKHLKNQRFSFVPSWFYMRSIPSESRVAHFFGISHTHPIDPYGLWKELIFCSFTFCSGLSFM